MTRLQRSNTLWMGWLMAPLLLAGCDEIRGIEILPYDPDNPQNSFCTIDEGEIFFGSTGRDAIPALSDPKFVRPGHAEAQYITPDDRVIGIRVGADVIAIPVRILWYHEIVNMDLSGRAVAITHCPLTGSSLVFDRGSADDAEFGVSGLLYRNNLMMYDRNDDSSLWPQMTLGAKCGPRTGMDLVTYASIEMRYASWLELHPETWVMSGETGHDNRYHVDPYGDYDQSDEVLFPVELDFRRPLKERVLGVMDDTGGSAYPFGELSGLGPVAVLEHPEPTTVDGSTVVFWDDEAQAAAAYGNQLDGTALTFGVVDGRIVDEETGSTWRVDGVADSGPLAGQSLEAVPEGFVAFWFAWAAFHPGTRLWEAP